MKYELSGKMMKRFVGLRAKTYTYFMQLYSYDGSEDKKAESTKKCVIKRKLNF